MIGPIKTGIRLRLTGRLMSNDKRSSHKPANLKACANYVHALLLSSSPA